MSTHRKVVPCCYSNASGNVCGCDENKPEAPADDGVRDALIDLRAELRRLEQRVSVLEEAQR